MAVAVAITLLSPPPSTPPTQQQRTSPLANDGLPLVPGAKDGVDSLQRILPIVAYLTVRPENVSANTVRWLTENGFPPAPVVSRPMDVPFENGNQVHVK
jgi:hypothetical protein